MRVKHVKWAAGPLASASGKALALSRSSAVCMTWHQLTHCSRHQRCHHCRGCWWGRYRRCSCCRQWRRRCKHCTQSRRWWSRRSAWWRKLQEQTMEAPRLATRVMWAGWSLQLQWPSVQALLGRIYDWSWRQLTHQSRRHRRPWHSPRRTLQTTPVVADVKGRNSGTRDVFARADGWRGQAATYMLARVLFLALTAAAGVGGASVGSSGGALAARGGAAV
jgi:hypothetical protein